MRAKLIFRTILTCENEFHPHWNRCRMFVVQTSTLYYLQACTENLQKIEGVCMQINQLVTESRVEVEDNSIV